MSDDNIFSEVSEDLRSERMRNLWRQYGPFVIGAAVLIVLLVAVNEGWRWYQNSVAAQSSEQFYAAFDLANDGDLAGAQDQLNTVIAEGSGGYPMLARYSQAALLAKDGRIDEAVAAYDAIATDQSDVRLRDLAFLFAANLLVDSGNVSAVEARVGGLIAPENPLRNSAREVLGLTQYTAGELDAARATFAEILNDPQASLEIGQRVQVYDAQLRSMGTADPEAVDESDEADPVE